MSAIVDLTGKRFGRLVVFCRSEERKFNKICWDCVCDCGQEKTVIGGYLKQGTVKSCGCLSSKSERSIRNIKDLSGQVFGRLTVEELAPYSNRNAKWTCLCSCGNRSTVSRPALLSGASTSCGCFMKEYLSEIKTENLIGQTFGQLKVIKRDREREKKRKGNRVIWECICTCGKTTFVSRSSLKSGNTKSCGCSRRPPIGDRLIDSQGYARIYLPDHPNALEGRVAEHVLEVSKLLNRPLYKGENVHHKNGVRDDNRTEGPLKADPETGRLWSGNLELWSTKQPPGQRPGDKVKWAREIIELYGQYFPEGEENV